MRLFKNLGFKGLLLLSFLAILTEVGAQEKRAQQPSIMIIPSDNLLMRLNCLRIVDNRGESVYVRNYQEAFVNSSDLGFIISALQGRFAEEGFPVKDLELTLKSVQQKAIIDDVNGYDYDVRAVALNVARPDIVLELNYESVKKGMGCVLSLMIKALDSYTMYAFSTSEHSGIESLDCNIKKALSDQTELNFKNLQNTMIEFFKSLKENGRKISMEVKVEANAINDFRKDKCGNDKPYNTWIYDWVRQNSVDLSGIRNGNTPKELLFSDIRIPFFDEKGIPIAASDWANKLIEAISEKCGVFAFDNTQDLGKAVVVFSQ